ncbi:MAG: SIMPL domain-containing protein [Chitinophagales bacterium]|nr:SIMPL domain-containing protein [Chitinophagales bacterium]
MMKRITTLLFVLMLVSTAIGQVSGNINYQNQIRYSDNNINISFPSNTDLFVSVKGLANVKADAYVAIFNVTQVGKTTEEVNNLIDERINKALENIRANPEVETYVDMLSFVPVYEHQIERKIFSKKTYNEIPAGFELKKNIHIKYADPNLLNQIIAILSNAEIYDLVRVDYFSNRLDAVKKELMLKAREVLQGKLENYEDILSVQLDSIEKQLVDGYRVVLPVEMYKSYQAYNSSSLGLKKSANVNQANKSTTLYYQPIVDKEFDFVLNPMVLEPVIQVMYEIKLKVNREKDQVQKIDKEYLFISPNGDLKKLDIE